MGILISYLIRFFVIEIHTTYFRTVYRALVELSHKFGIQVMARNLFKPLFGFPGVWTRITGAVFRFFAILLGAVVIFFILCLAIAVYPLFFIWAFYMLKFYPLVFVSIIVGFVVVYLYRLIFFPIIQVTKVLSPGDLPLSADYHTRKVLNQLLSQNSLGGIKVLETSDDIQKFNLICEIDHQDVFEYLRKEWPPLNKNVFFSAVQEYSKAMSSRYMSVEVAYVAILKNFHDIDLFLTKNKSTMQFVEGSLNYIEQLRRTEPHIWQDDYIVKPAGGIDKAWASGFTAILNQYSTDLTKLAINGRMPKLIGREDVKKRFVDILSKPTRNNVLLIGKSGCGKTAFVRAMANEIANGTDIPALKYKRIVALDVGALTSGHPGEVNARLVRIIKEIEASGNIIVFIDEIQNVSANLNPDPNAVSAFNTFEPYLSSGSFQFIGATSMDNYLR